MLGVKRKATKRSADVQETEEAACSLQLLASVSKRPRAAAVKLESPLQNPQNPHHPSSPSSTSTSPSSPSLSRSPKDKDKDKDKDKEKKDEYRVLANCPRWRSWPHIEEVFLIGAVMERFFTRGSLSSSKKKEDGEHCWTSIKNIYDHAWKTHLGRTGDTREFLCRSANALARHYKVMKERIMHNQYSENRDFRQFYFEWETKYNKNNVLLVGCEDVVPFSSGKHLSKHMKVRQTPTAEHTLGNHKFDDDLSELPKSRWSYEEEVFLVAAVLERFFQRGSLASTRMDIGSNECWTSIKQTYDYIKGRYHCVYGGAVQGKFARVKRSARALTRHFKVMKVRFTESAGHDNLKKYYMDWKTKYNVDGSILSYDGERKETVHKSPQTQTQQRQRQQPQQQQQQQQQQQLSLGVPSSPNQQQQSHAHVMTTNAQPGCPSVNVHNPMMPGHPMWYLNPQATPMGMMQFQALQLQQFNMQQQQQQQQQQQRSQQTPPLQLKLEQTPTAQLQQPQLPQQLQQGGQQGVKPYSPQAVMNFYNLSTLANMLNTPTGPTQVAT